MLFGLLDYRNYLLQRGKYAPAAIERTGARLMTRENFPDPSIYKPGELFLMHTRTSFLSWLIMYFQSGEEGAHGIWSHVGTFSYDGNIIDVTTEGVVEHPFTDYFDGQSYVLVLDIPYPDEGERDDAVAYGRSKLGAPYGWSIAITMGMSVLLGRDAKYHPKFSADVLIVLALLSLPGLLWKKWFYITGVIALHYLVSVALNRPIRERDRALHASSVAENREINEELRTRNRADEAPTDRRA